jgi:hypothetical protein
VPIRWVPFLVLLLLLAGTGNRAVAQTVDLSLEVSIIPSTYVPPGSSATITLTITNRGSTPANNPTVVSGLIPRLQFAVVRVQNSGPCMVAFDDLSGFPPYDLAGLTFPPIPAGGSISCSLGVIATPRAAGSAELDFVARDITPGVINSPLASRFRTLLLIFDVHAVPTTSPFGSLAIAVLCLWFGLRRMQWGARGCSR